MENTNKIKIDVERFEELIVAERNYQILIKAFIRAFYVKVSKYGESSYLDSDIMNEAFRNVDSDGFQALFDAKLIEAKEQYEAERKEEEGEDE